MAQAREDRSLAPEAIRALAGGGTEELERHATTADELAGAVDVRRPAGADQRFQLEAGIEHPARLHAGSA